MKRRVQTERRAGGLILYGLWTAWLGLLLGGLAGAWLMADVPPITLDALIDSLQRRYGAMEGFSAEFQQIYTSTINSVRREESGMLYMKKPGRMRWEYQKPEVKLFVSDGRRSFFYVPSDRQVTERRYTAEDIQSVPILFLLGQGDIRRDFSVSWEVNEPKRRGDNYFIRLRPKSQSSAFSLVMAEIQPSDFTIERLVVVDPTEDRSEFLLTHFTVDTKLKDDLFKFKIPKGVEVLNADDH